MEEATAKPKVTPKDFFLWLAGIVTLYVSTTSLILLVHQYIEVYFPNQLISYGDPYSGTIRFAIASLVVMFPLYIWIMHTLHKDILAVPEKKEIWVRRWLVFLTLFIAGLTMAIDVISTVYVYLQGDISIRFILKALSILIVLGTGFWYHLEEFKGTWAANPKLSKLVGAVVSVIVLVAVAASFFIIGSPETARLQKLDAQRISDLQNIQYQVLNYWQQKGKLPGSIADMEDPLIGFVAPRDPQTGAGYTYTSGEGMSFSLCADFSAPSRSTDTTTRPAMPGDLYNENWQHEKGQKCFERTIDPDKFPPLKKQQI